MLPIQFLEVLTKKITHIWKGL